MSPQGSDHPRPGETAHDVGVRQEAEHIVRAGVIRNALALNVQPDDTGVIAALSFKPPAGVSGWKRIRIANYSPYAFQVLGVPGGGNGDPPQIIEPFQQNVWPYYASRGTVYLTSPTPPLALPPLRFAYGAGTAKDQLLYNFVSVEWTDTPELFSGSYPVPLTGVCISAEALLVAPVIPTVIAVGNAPVGVATDPVTNTVYVANNSDNTVSVINGATNEVTATVHVGTAPLGLAVNPTTNRIYVANNGANTVSVIDGTSNIVIGVVAVGNGPVAVAVDPVTNKVYVANSTGNSVTVIDGATNLVTATVAVGTSPQGLDVDTTTDLIYTANSVDNTVTVINGATNTVVGPPIVVGNGPQDVAVDSTRNLIYVTNQTDDTVSVIDGSIPAVTATVAVGAAPLGIAVDPVTNKVYVANLNGNSISVIDGTSDTVVATLSPGIGPNYIAVNPSTNVVYVTITANAVTVLQGVS
jgi:YVTN family beta-propeller protein